MLMRDDTGLGLTKIIFERRMIPDLVPQWRALARASVEDSVYYAPDYALPALDTIAASDDIRLVTAWDDDRLVALLPVVLPRIAVPGLSAHGGNWMTDYHFSGFPLLDARNPEAAAIGLIDGLAQLKRGEWIISEMNCEGPAARALIGALDRRGAPYRWDRSFQRASLPSTPSFDEHMQRHVGSKRRRELRRTRRRLEELGQVTLRSETQGQGLRDAIDIFLALEASGWKGERGTALACRPDTRAFAEKAFGAADAPRRVDILLLDGKPVAAGVIVFSGRTGFTVKGAYDEAFASHSVGLLLEQEVIRSLLTEKWADRLDSATNGSHVIDYLWPDRVAVADLVLSLAPAAAEWRLDALCRTRTLARQAKARIKALLKR